MFGHRNETIKMLNWLNINDTHHQYNNNRRHQHDFSLVDCCNKGITLNVAFVGEMLEMISSEMMLCNGNHKSESMPK